MYQLTESERKTLVDGMVYLFDEYGYRYTHRAIDRIIDEWATNKEELINIFKKHPNYVEGKFLIAFSRDYDRVTEVEGIRDFGNWLIAECVEKREFIEALPEEVTAQRKAERCTCLPDRMYRFIRRDHSGLSFIFNQFLTQANADHINEIFPTIKAKKGQKTSRVTNKICNYLGYDRHPDYNREFAKYADSLNPLKIVRHTVLSVNPLDYLTMSFGNSWGSCHSIDKRNKRNLPNSYSGCYSSGTISYMLDSPSFVMYTVDSEYAGTEFYFESKINRQMFHYESGKLVQARLYPQSNDDEKGAYTPYRNIVQSVLCECLNLPNLWDVRRGSDPLGTYIRSRGTHYRDYAHFDACNMSFLRDHWGGDTLYIGHDPICIECGDEHTKSGCINCCHDPDTVYYTCADCGCEIDSDDDDAYVQIDGKYYCTNCVVFCTHCDEWVRKCEAEEVGDRWYCDLCLKDSYVCEDCGKSFFIDEQSVKDGKILCDECRIKLLAKAHNLDTSREPKPGDYVLIRPDLHTGHYCNWHNSRDVDCVPDMVRAAGEITKVLRYGGYDRQTFRVEALGDCWYWSSGMFAGILTEKPEEADGTEEA